MKYDEDILEKNLSKLVRITQDRTPLKDGKNPIFTFLELNGSSFEQTHSPSHKASLCQIWLKIGPVVLGKKNFKFRRYIFAIS